MSQGEFSPEVPIELTEFRSEWLVAVGSNQTTQTTSLVDVILSGVAKLGEFGHVIRKMSALYCSPAFPPGNGPDFVNAAFVMEADTDAKAVLQILHDVEAAFGRQRKTRWAARTLDLDLIGRGDLVLPNEATVRHWMDLPLEQQAKHVPDQLLLPHPRVQDRAFVLVPLMDIAPDWVHPLTGKSVRQMVNALPKAERDSVKPLVNQPEQP